MKKILIIVCSLFLFSSINAQKVFTNEKDVYDSETLFFYGFDYSGLRIADGTRIGQNLMPFFPAVTKLMEGGHNQKYMEVKFKKAKGKITYNTSPAVKRNEKINNGKVAAEEARKLTPDSLSAMVKRYELPETEGIGYTIIFECFDRSEQTISEYIVFFDIATRNIISTKYLVSKDGNGYNYMGDWKKASIKAVDRLIDAYAKDLNTYKKAQKGK